MTVSELINKLKDCAPNAEVVRRSYDTLDGYWNSEITTVNSDGETVEII